MECATYIIHWRTHACCYGINSGDEYRVVPALHYTVSGTPQDACSICQKRNSVQVSLERIFGELVLPAPSEATGDLGMAVIDKVDVPVLRTHKSVMALCGFGQANQNEWWSD